jgi:hypothetical protein
MRTVEELSMIGSVAFAWKGGACERGVIATKRFHRFYEAGRGMGGFLLTFFGNWID